MVQPAKSATLQLLQGNPNKENTEKLKRRADHEAKMKMKSDKLIAPNTLDKLGKQAFNLARDELIAIDLITNVDIYHLELYADAYSQYNRFKQIIKETGEYDDNGTPNPFYVRMEKAAAQLRSFSTDLGLSPSARAKLAIKLAENDSGDDDDF